MPGKACPLMAVNPCCFGMCLWAALAGNIPYSRQFSETKYSWLMVAACTAGKGSQGRFICG